MLWSDDVPLQLDVAEVAPLRAAHRCGGGAAEEHLVVSGAVTEWQQVVLHYAAVQIQEREPARRLLHHDTQDAAEAGIC